MKLHSSPISPNGKRVCILAAELGVPIETRNLDFAQGENRTPEYLALNPMGKIPTATEGDFALWESAAILCWVAQKSEGGAAVFPREPNAQADVLRWLFWCSCHVDPYFTTLVFERFIKARRGGTCDDAACAYAEGWLQRFVPVLEQQLQGREYVTGAFSLADIALGCTLELSPLCGFDLAAFPAVRAWLERLQARPSWSAPR